MKKVILSISVLLSSFSLVFAQNVGTIKGKIEDSNGKKVSEVKITARQDNKDVKTVITDSNGEFFLTELPVGKYNIAFEKYGYSIQIIYNFDVQKNKTKSLKNLILMHDKGTQVIFNGSVFDQNGMSLPKVKVEIEKITENGMSQQIGKAETNERGEFSSSFPEDSGIYRIKATRDKITIIKEIDVTSAAIYRFSLIFDK